MDALNQLGLRNSLLTEIKKISDEIPLALKEKDDDFEQISTKYWTWYPCCPDTDAGDLYLAQADFRSANVGEIVKAFELLYKIIFFVREYKPELKDLM